MSVLPAPLGKYPRYRRAGPFVFVSGISARLPDGSIDGVRREGDQVHRDVVQQTHRVLANVGEILRSAGATLADCVDVTVFLTDPQDFAACNAVYGEYFAADAPARTTVIVRGLPHPDMVVELKVTAWLAGPA